MKSKEKIVQSLIELMRTNEFETITVKNISQLAQINRSTYYRNFKSKEDIIGYKLESIMNEYLEEFQNKQVKNKETYIQTILETFLKYDEFFKIIHKQNQSYIIQKVLIKFFSNKLENTSKKEKYQIYYHIGGIYNFIICWIENNMEDEPANLAKIGAKITSNIEPYLI
ncbi:MAG: TetR/AcrR family transcriptional regulator [Methanobrevibacter thaueri]|nr:TetR/AcrR family transcriptional regulator [Methanobrevibacter thaueri]